MFLIGLGVEFYIVAPPADACPVDQRRSDARRRPAGGTASPAAAPEVFLDLFTPLH
jgi:hypothetical protein